MPRSIRGFFVFFPSKKIPAGRRGSFTRIQVLYESHTKIGFIIIIILACFLNGCVLSAVSSVSKNRFGITGFRELNKLLCGDVYFIVWRTPGLFAFVQVEAGICQADVGDNERLKTTAPVVLKGELCVIRFCLRLRDFMGI